MIQNANAIFCIAEKEKLSINKLIKNYKGLFFTIPNPIYVENKPLDCSTHTDLHLAQEKRLVYMGRYDIQHKGLDILLKIFKKIEEKHANFSLHLYGKGKDLAKIKRMAQHLLLCKVFIHESVFGEEKWEALRAAVAYIQTSRWEAFGISIFEAASIGKPLVVSEGAYMKDFILKQDIGIVLDQDIDKAAEQIVKFCTDTNKLNEIGLRIRESVENNFSAHVVGRLLENAYLQVINNP